jgi:hypothetical protein
MNSTQVARIELLIRKNALKDVEIWLNQQYVEIDKKLEQLEENEEANNGE